jgi:spermidine synthase
MKKIISALLCTCAFSLINADEWVTENLYPGWKQTFRVDEKLYEEQTPEQHLLIFKNDLFGKVLVLDDIIQLTEKDDPFYQEMMVHVPLLAHGNAKKILVLGGGDGGIIREVLRHKNVQEVTLVEIDPAVVAFSKKYLPEISKGAFEEERVRLIIQDACLFVKATHETFDIIICDSTDPVGPGKVLFTNEFYKDCHKILNANGIFVNQNGVPFLQQEELIQTYNSRKNHFQDTGFYLSVIPTYVGGFMAIGWATDNLEYRNITVESLEERMKNIHGEMKYYTPEIHKASFALPKFIQNSLQ